MTSFKKFLFALSLLFAFSAGISAFKLLQQSYDFLVFLLSCVAALACFIESLPGSNSTGFGYRK